MKITEIKANPKNPRVVKDDKFKKLCKSIKEFPEMMELRPIVIDENNIVLGGNMRLQALKTLGYDEIPNQWVKIASDLTETQKKEFIIKDNSNYGDWDFDILANEWSDYDLDDWGLDVLDKSMLNGDIIDECSELNFEYAENLGITREYLVVVFNNNDEYDLAKKSLNLQVVKESNNQIRTQRVIKYENLRSFLK
jgi:hypothetical protein